MPNKKAKTKKQQRAKINKQLKKQGRTAKQYKKRLEKEPDNKTSVYGRR